MKRYGVLFLVGIAGSLMAMELPKVPLAPSKESFESNIRKFMEDEKVLRRCGGSYTRPKKEKHEGDVYSTLAYIQEIKEALMKEAREQRRE